MRRLRGGLWLAALLAARAARAEDGGVAWATFYDGPAQGQDLVNAITLGPDGSVYATGESNYGSRTIKLDADGRILWSVDAGGTAVRLAPDGNLIVGGGGDWSIYGEDNVAKITPDGTVLWKRAGHAASYLELDAQGNVYTAATPWQYAGFYAAKLDASGNLLWQQHFDTYAGSVTGLAVDAAGDAYVLGAGNGVWTPLEYLYDYVVVKYAPDGTVLWSRAYDGPAGAGDVPKSIALDAAGDVIVAGTATVGAYVHWNGSTVPVKSVTVVKYDPDGALLWTSPPTVPPDATYASDYQYDMALAPDGAVYVAALRGGYPRGMLLVKYSGDGARQWEQVYAATHGDAVGRQVAADPEGGAYLVGDEDGVPYFLHFTRDGVLDRVRTYAAQVAWNGPSDLGALGMRKAIATRDDLFFGAGATPSFGAWDFLVFRLSRDRDGDGFPWYRDCRDADPSVHAGAAEVPHDGVDQDCNGYDLTIDVVKAHFTASEGSLRVEAASALGASAGLSVEGIGAMTWKPSPSRWVLSATLPASPGQVNVCGVEGCRAAPVILQ